MIKQIIRFWFSTVVLTTSACSLFAQNSAAFEIRGVLPWHNFLSGPTAWNEADYEKYLDECQKQNINFIGFHNYTGGGERYATYVEPMIKIAYKNILPLAYFDNSTTARWGYLPRKVTDFAFGTSRKYFLLKGATGFGSNCSVLSSTPQEHYEKAQRLMQNVLKMAHAREIKMAMGFEFGVLPPEYFSLNGFYWLGKANMVPDPTHPTSIELHYAALDNILETYPEIDYVWLWLNEHCFMGIDAKEVINRGGRFADYYKQNEGLFKETDDENLKFIGIWSMKYMQLTIDYLKKKAPGVKVILGGWGGSNQLPLLMRGLDRGLPANVVFSCLNPAMGIEPQPAFLTDIAKNRKVWAIPWLEGDQQLWHQQPRVNLLRLHVQLAAKQKLNGVVAIHWRTEDVKLNKETFAYFASHPLSNKTTEETYSEHIEREYGKAAVAALLPDLVRWDTEQSLNHGFESPEYFVFSPYWGILNDANYRFREELVNKLTQLIATISKGKQKENLEWLKNTVEFELLLHRVNKAMLPAYNLKTKYVENGIMLSAELLNQAKLEFNSAPVERLFTVYASKTRSRGELGVLSSLNQRLWQTYTELKAFLDSQSYLETV